MVAACAMSLRGSPPRMRGKVGFGIQHRTFSGITPAYAGKRMPGRLTLAISEDHPRVCGEKTKKIP